MREFYFILRFLFDGGVGFGIRFINEERIFGEEVEGYRVELVVFWC